MWPFDRKSRRVRSAQAYWLLRNGIGDASPRTGGGAGCDIAIIGAGITGALVADALVEAGGRIVILDSHEPGQGSTSASTALLQYEIDTHLADLTRLIGAERALLAYRAGVDSLDRLERRFGDLLPAADYERRPSLYLASDEKAVSPLQVEAAARRAIGLDCRWLDGDEVLRRFGCRRPGAILSARGAQIDPLRFTRSLLAGCARHGVEIRPRTRVESIDTNGATPVLRLAGGDTLSARHVVVCAGYESLQFLDRDVADIDNTFAVITGPVEDASLPLVWESARPYLYIRTTRDRRLIVGGGDVPFDSVAARELLLPAKSLALARSYEDLFGRPLPPVEYSWAGSFATTRDGLPYIGPVPGRHPRVQYALCYGGNGITYSLQAGDLVRAHIEGRGHALHEVFGFGRDSRRSGTDPPGNRQEGNDLRLDPSRLVQDPNRQTGTPISNVPS